MAAPVSFLRGPPRDRNVCTCGGACFEQVCHGEELAFVFMAQDASVRLLCLRRALHAYPCTCHGCRRLA